ncbi:Alpha/beta hydrolase family domain-containing protein [Rozella allomycis CSF55]|uniref:Alpha/beta hydrolase family domain-containing protein n=1 Tax=Rozella allomycis (strain CSF55) TaxID=988480 RepID=A0A075B185_ROZAC|nr:Alpha/beta hydrolase family domain-containing protein [Rozella allomycis CSF55]|eukprot:EPZ36103.1 Alpha/beta hydrolase family domain-containing protein [Rozella allomycis CSF55]
MKLLRAITTFIFYHYLTLAMNHVSSLEESSTSNTLPPIWELTSNEEGHYISTTEGMTYYVFSRATTENSSLVVFLHGFISSHEVFRPLYEQYRKQDEKEFSFLSIDLYGHGNSSFLPPGLEYNVNIYSEQILDVLDIVFNGRYNIHNLVLVGHSMGAVIAAEFAKVHPTLVSGLVLLTPGGLPHRAISVRDIPKKYDYLICRALHRAGTHSLIQKAVVNTSAMFLEQLYNVLCMLPDSSLTGINNLLAKIPLVPRKDFIMSKVDEINDSIDLIKTQLSTLAVTAKPNKNEYLKMVIDVLNNVEMYVDRTDLYSDLSQRGISICLVLATKDILAPLHDGLDLKVNVLKDAHLVVMDGSHFLPYEKPAEVLTRIKEFIRRIPILPSS